ncbi:hypothetical protein [Nocardioides aquiterrae]|uniref:DUF732 domain-containing protein n=1 Tax=Nocardioides aquiterrae TaxID=203799 RepID=A0ABN1U7Q9_9ACTN
MRTALTLAGFVLVLGGLAGCGGGDSDGGDGADSGGLPTSASKEEFCGNFKSLAEDLGKLDPNADPSTAVQALHDAADHMRATGTPADIPDDARHGLEVTLDAIAGLPDDATAEDIGKLEESLSEQEQKDASAFDSYLSDECPELG